MNIDCKKVVWIIALIAAILLAVNVAGATPSFTGCVGSSTKSCATHDYNNDGVVGLPDFSIYIANMEVPVVSEQGMVAGGMTVDNLNRMADSQRHMMDVCNRTEYVNGVVVAQYKRCELVGGTQYDEKLGELNQQLNAIGGIIDGLMESLGL
jgi:hypothetical protein